MSNTTLQFWTTLEVPCCLPFTRTPHPVSFIATSNQGNLLWPRARKEFLHFNILRDLFFFSFQSKSFEIKPNPLLDGASNRVLQFASWNFKKAAVHYSRPYMIIQAWPENGWACGGNVSRCFKTNVQNPREPFSGSLDDFTSASCYRYMNVYDCERPIIY